MQVVAAVALCGWMLLCWGCSRGPSRVEVPQLDATSAARAAMQQLDADSNGTLTEPELEKSPGLRHALPRMDLNADKALTTEEIAGRIQEYLRQKIGAISFVGTVVLDGKPLAGAEVNFVPEEFLRLALQPCKVTTDASGQFRPQAPGLDVPGLPPGIYRIVISKKDVQGTELVPARYNTETTLGVEVAMDSPVVGQGLDLQLSSR